MFGLGRILVRNLFKRVGFEHSGLKRGKIAVESLSKPTSRGGKKGSFFAPTFHPPGKFSSAKKREDTAEARSESLTAGGARRANDIALGALDDGEEFALLCLGDDKAIEAR